MKPSSLNPQSPQPVSTEHAWLLWSEAGTSDRGLSSTIHPLNIISLLLQSSDSYTYEDIIGLQTPNKLWRGGWGVVDNEGDREKQRCKMRKENWRERWRLRSLRGSWDAAGASHFPTSLGGICFVSLTRNTLVRWQKWDAQSQAHPAQIKRDLWGSSVAVD